jgi:hypothetical protein
MLVVNLTAGPGAGKSTGAYFITALLKMNKVRAELVHEAAKRFIYKGADKQLKNQVYVMAKQWSHIADLASSGCEVAVSDSPLVQNLIYAEACDHYEELKNLTVKLDASFPQFNIFVRRVKDFEAFGRVQKTVEEAIPYDIKARALMGFLGKRFDLEIDGSEEGYRNVTTAILQILRPV